MSSEIHLRDQFLWVSNHRLSTLIAFALEVAAEKADSPFERECVTELHEFAYEGWPGHEFDLHERFPRLEEKKFWAGVFHDVARRIFLRQIGNHRISHWQSSAIGDAYIIARMLTRAVQEIEIGWRPTTENAREAAETVERSTSACKNLISKSTYEAIRVSRRSTTSMRQLMPEPTGAVRRVGGLYFIDAELPADSSSGVFVDFPMSWNRCLLLIGGIHPNRMRAPLT